MSVSVGRGGCSAKRETLRKADHERSVQIVGLVRNDCRLEPNQPFSQPHRHVFDCEKMAHDTAEKKVRNVCSGFEIPKAEPASQRRSPFHVRATR